MKLKKRKKKNQKKYNHFIHYIFNGENPFERMDNVHKLNYWRIIKPDFEYDRVLNAHYLLVPIRKTKYFVDLSDEAKKEFFEIKSGGYSNTIGKMDYFLVNKDVNMTIKCIFHAHIGKRKWWFLPIVERLFF